MYFDKLENKNLKRVVGLLSLLLFASGLAVIYFNAPFDRNLTINANLQIGFALLVAFDFILVSLITLRKILTNNLTVEFLFINFLNLTLIFGYLAYTAESSRIIIIDEYPDRHLR